MKKFIFKINNDLNPFVKGNKQNIIDFVNSGKLKKLLNNGVHTDDIR